MLCYGSTRRKYVSISLAPAADMVRYHKARGRTSITATRFHQRWLTRNSSISHVASAVKRQIRASCASVGRHSAHWLEYAH